MPGFINPNIINTAVPNRLLESYIPFFKPLHDILFESTGIDITDTVSTLVFVLLVGSAFSYSFSRLHRLLWYWFSSSVTIRKDDQLYEVVLSWISRHAMSASTTHLMARTQRANEHDAMVGFARRGDDGIGQFNFKNWDAAKAPVYIPAYGRHRFWYNGTLFFLDRQQAKVDILQGQTESQDQIHIQCWGLSTARIKKLIQTCKHESAVQQRAKTTVRSPHYSSRAYWTEAATRPSRPLDTVYLKESDKEALIEDIKEFLHPAAVRFYAHRGIPYRRGYLFHGPAGTGKTSLSLALAGLFGMELYVLSLVEHTMTDQRLATLFSTMPQRCIVLLEDIDTAGLASRKTDDESGKKLSSRLQALEKIKSEAGEAPSSLGRLRPRPPNPVDQGVVTLSGLLNAIDGVASQEGRILIMTTNNPESLDKALIRPGRVDMQVYFGHLTKDNAREIFKRMYIKEYTESGDEPSKSMTRLNSNIDDGDASAASLKRKEEEERIGHMADTFASRIPELTFTPAEVQGFLIMRRKDPQLALDEVVQWSEELLAAKAAGKNVLGGIERSKDQGNSESPSSGEWVDEKLDGDAKMKAG